MALTTHAAEYSWLVIHQTSGADTYMKANGTRFSVADGKLMVVHTDGTSSFNLTDLSYMAFTNEPAGVESVLSENGGEVDVYSDNGLYIGHFNSVDAARASLTDSGVYVFKNRKGTAKIMITK